MKNSKNTIAKLVVAVAFAAILMLQSAVAFARPNVEFYVSNNGTNIAMLKIKSAQGDKPVIISIKDAWGKVLHTEKSRMGHYEKPLNFSNLAEGQYFIDMKYEDGMIRKVMIKGENGLSFQEQDLYVHNIISYKAAEQKVYVRSTSNLNQPASIRISNSKGEVIHEQKNITQDSFISKLDLSKLEKGAYEVTVVNGNVSSQKTIKL